MRSVLVRHSCWFFNGPIPNSSIFQSRSSISSDSGCRSWRCEYISPVVGLSSGCSGTVKIPNTLLWLEREREKDTVGRCKISRNDKAYWQSTHILAWVSSPSFGSVNIESESSDRICLTCSSVSGGKVACPPCVWPFIVASCGEAGTESGGGAAGVDPEGVPVGRSAGVSAGFPGCVGSGWTCRGWLYTRP